MPKEPTTTSSFAIVLGVLVVIMVAILITPSPHHDLNQLADYLELQGPERASFIYLLSEARRQPISERLHNEPENEQQLIYDNQLQLLEELSQFLTPMQLEFVEQQCIMPNKPSCQLPES